MSDHTFKDYVHYLQITVDHAALVKEHGLPSTLPKAIGVLLARVRELEKSAVAPAGVDVQALVRDLTAKAESLERELGLTKGERDGLTKSIEAMGHQIADAVNERDAARARIRELEKALANDESKPARKTTKKGEVTT